MIVQPFTITVAAPPPPTGWPDDSNTGVPPGTVLKPSGSIRITTQGAVIEGLDVKGTVYIDASGVTVKNCRIASSDYYVVHVGAGGATVQDCDIDNLGAGGAGISGAGKFLRNNIHGCADGINVAGSNTLIEGNYIHGMKGTSGSHYDGIQADGNFSNLTIRHNTVVNEQTQTSAMMLDNYWGPINNVVIDGNVFIGGGFTAYLDEVRSGQQPGGPVTNVSFTNNRMGKGYYGYFHVTTELGHTPVISGNVDYTTGQPVNP